MTHPSLRKAATRFACAFSLLLTIPLAQAQLAGGGVSGTVVDASTGKFLQGADVSIDAGAAHTATSRDGRFTFSEVPAGSHTLSVSYPGFEASTSNVTVTAGQIANVPVRLGAASDIVRMSEFTVAGAKEGMAQAIALQRVAVNAKVVAAGDQYGDIAEGNAAEYLKFLPGVGIDYNANDARAVTLRGLSTQFTNVLMDGDPIASATSGNLNRRFEFEQVAINNVENIEVVKTLTPDRMATSTAGDINFVSKSALDREGNLFTYRAYLQATNSDLYLRKTEGWGQEQTRKILPGVDFNYAYHIRPNLGVNVAYKNSQLFNNYPRSSYSWEYNPANGGLPTNPALTSWNLQNEQKDTRRQTASVQFDWKIDDHTKISLLNDWNFYDLLFTDRTITINTGALAALSTTSTPAYGNGTVAGLPGKGSVSFQTINRWKSGVTWDFPLNIEHTFDNGSQLNASAYWSQAYSKYRDTTGSWYSDATMQRSNLTVTFHNIGEVVPSYTIADASGNPVDIRDVGTGFAMTQIRSRPQTGVDTRNGVAADYKFDLHTTFPTTVKIGGRDDISTRNIVDPIFNRSGTSAATGFGGASAITGPALVNLVDNGFSNHGIGYGLPAYNFISVYKAYTYLGGNNYLPYTPASDIQARFEDTTKAGYVRLDVTPVKNLLIVGGVRYEDRVTDSTNHNITVKANNSSQFTDQSWFPSVNIKYTLANNLILRASYAKSIGLPDYSDLLPGQTVTDPTSTARGKISVYNPGLQAYRIDNYDAGIEYYFSHSGLIAASVFRKDFKNYITTISRGLDANLASELGVNTSVLGAPVDQYDASYRINVNDPARYTGLEFQFAQNLTFLPKPFNTLGIQINGTLLHVDPIKSNFQFTPTDAALNIATLEQINKNLEIAAVKRALNVELNYSYGKWGFNIVTNYTGYVLKGISLKTVQFSDINPATGKKVAPQYFNELQYQAPRELVDLRIDYKWNRRYTPYFQVRNIFGRPIIMSTPTLPFNHAEYGDPIYELGVRGVW